METWTIVLIIVGIALVLYFVLRPKKLVAVNHGPSEFQSILKLVPAVTSIVSNYQASQKSSDD
jgi:hypothetical protein